MGSAVQTVHLADHVSLWEHVRTREQRGRGGLASVGLLTRPGSGMSEAEEDRAVIATDASAW